jgi:hypothetical protein
MQSKGEKNDTTLIRLYNAGGRQVYQWGTCETVVGMGMDNTAWRGLHRTRGGTAWDMVHHS